MISIVMGEMKGFWAAMTGNRGMQENRSGFCAILHFISFLKYKSVEGVKKAK